jgi:toxin CcdB
MAPFNLYRLASGLLVVDLQMDLIAINASRVVAPLRAVDRYVAFPGMTPGARPGTAIGSSELRNWPL